MNTGRRYLLTNNSPKRNTFFKDSTGAVITNPANLSTATSLVITGLGEFNVSELAKVRALRGVSSAKQKDNYDTTSVVNTVTATLTADAIYYVIFDFVFTGIQGQFNQNDSIEQGASRRPTQIIVPAGTTAANFEAAFLASFFNKTLFDKLKFSGNYFLNPTIPVGATVSGTYVDGTTFTGITTTVIYSGYKTVDFAQAVASFSLVSAVSIEASDYRFLWKNPIVSDEFPQVVSKSSTIQAFNRLGTSSNQEEGRNTGVILNDNYFLPTIDRRMPYTPNYEPVVLDFTTKYTEIYFTVGKNVQYKTWTNVVDQKLSNELEYYYFVQENTDTLNTTVVLDADGNVTQGLIKALLTVIGLNSNYEMYDENYFNATQTQALRTAVLTGAGAWNQVTHSGVIRTVTTQLTADVTAFIN